MSFTDLIFGINPAGTQIAALRLDALAREDIDFPSTVTKYPVEDGSPISDAILPDAPTLSISGIISATSATVLGGLGTSGYVGGKTRILNAIDALQFVYTEHVPVTVVTGLGVYENMGMSTCKIARNNGPQGGNTIEISAEFTRIRKVVLKTADVPAADDATKGKAGATKAAAGKASPAEPPPAAAEKSGSILQGLKSKFFGG